MQKEEKQLELSLESMIQRVSELKNSIGALIFKLEHEYETLNWPSLLDNFALLSGQLNSLSRVLKSDKMPSLKSQLILPIELSPEPCENLGKLTEGRVMMFNHEIAPNYLRTKLEPDVEEKTQQLTNKAQQVTQDLATKQLNNLNKVTSNLLDIINSTREEWENDSSHKNSQPQTSSVADRDTLVSASLHGKNLKTNRGRLSESPQAGMSQQKMQNPTMAKAQSSIKTQIKVATSGHPYTRP
ncbi:mediator of RNA polymerase II transcription subunit 8-like [Ruditapes philippinarum]|uniref:mediator of RNA polymerase II transcription subunit 8-like n=1 Tax=Ruditapes philippinarum TaxID=129788 RepID=UPI00295B99FF|nr:mediator of RNA polymerase II transcription subunit 8-like [Ruditapes philippinarum]